MKKNEEATNPESELIGSFENLSKHSERLLADINSLNQQVDDLAKHLPIYLADVHFFTPDEYEKAAQDATDFERETVERLEELDKKRTEILYAWENLAAETVAKYENVSLLHGGSLLQLGNYPLHELSKKRNLAHFPTLKVGLIKKLIGSDHRQAQLQLDSHKAVLAEILEEYKKIKSTDDKGAGTSKEDVADLAKKIKDGVRKNIFKIIDQNMGVVEGKMAELSELAKDEKFLDQIDEEVHERMIKPIIEFARGDQDTTRDQLLVEWEKSLVALLKHGLNESLPKDDPEDKLLPQPARNYGERQRLYQEAIRKTYPRDPYESWKSANPEDDSRHSRIDRVDLELRFDANNSPQAQTTNIVTFFSEWRANNDFTQKIKPFDRPGLNVDLTKRKLEAKQKTNGWQEYPGTLVERLAGLKRWHVIKVNPDFVSRTSQAERDEFEDYLIELLVEKVIRPGGTESSSGTSAAHLIDDLNNVRALPYLLEHILYTGAGHTNREVYGVIKEMAQSDAGGELIKKMTGVQKELFAQIRDKESILHRESHNHGYSEPSYLSQGEFFLAKTKLYHLFSAEKTGVWDLPQNNQFINGRLDQDEVLEILKANEAEVKKIVEDSQETAPWWTINGLTEALSSDTEFVKRLSLSLLDKHDEAREKKLDHFLSHKKVTTSHQARSTFLQGILTLRTFKSEGKKTLSTLLDRYEGTKDDPIRIRKLLRYIEILTRFNAYEMDYDPEKSLVEIDNELKKISENLTKHKDDKKELRKRRHDAQTNLKILNDSEERGLTHDEMVTHYEREIAGIEQALEKGQTKFGPQEEKEKELKKSRQNHEKGGGSLIGLLDYFQNKMANLLTEKLKVASHVADKLASEIDYYFESGLIDIYTTLLLSYEAKKTMTPQLTLKEIISQITTNNFIKWKYSHEKAEIQIGFLGDKKQTWQNNIKPVEMEASPDEEATIEYQKNQASKLLKDAELHLAESDSISKTKIEEKMKGIQKILNESPFVLKNLYSLVDNTINICKNAGLNQVSLDLEQLLIPFKIKEVGNIIADEFDDPVRLLKMGTEPTETCQSWKRGQYNECLLGYVADANKKGLNIKDSDNGRVLLRGVERITTSKKTHDDKSPQDTLFLEPPYSALDHPTIGAAYAKLVFNKAEAMTAVIQISTAASGWTTQLKESLVKEASARGMIIEPNVTRHLYLAPSINEFEYSDSLGGKITAHGEYQEQPLIMEFRKVA